MPKAPINVELRTLQRVAQAAQAVSDCAVEWKGDFVVEREEMYELRSALECWTSEPARPSPIDVDAPEVPE